MGAKWRYPAGSANPVNGVVLTTANCAWVSSEIGDDGNPGTDVEPYASVGAAIGKAFIVVSGFFFNDQPQSSTLIGDGNAYFRNNIFPGFNFFSNGNSGLIYNCSVLGFGRITANISHQNSYFDHFSSLSMNYNGNVDSRSIILLSNVQQRFSTSGSTLILKDGLEFFNQMGGALCKNAIITGNCDVEMADIGASANVTYSIFTNDIAFKFTGGGLGSDESTFTTASTITELRNRAAAVYGGSADDYFIGCQVLPPTIFNDDYSLNTTPEGLKAATGSDTFSFCGAKDIALQWKPGTADFLWTTNLQLVNGKYELIDKTQPGIARGAWKTFGKVREIKRQFFTGSEAPLNGQVIDSTPSWGPEIEPDTGTNSYTGLTESEYYTVTAGGGVTYNGNLKSVGQTFRVLPGITTAVDNDGTGKIRQQLEAPNKKNIRWRLNEGGFITNNIASGQVSQDNWLLVLEGSINDGTNTYTKDQFLQYNSALTYTGTYKIQFVAAEEADFLEMEVSSGNNLSTDSTGRGNGDPDFDYTTESGIRAKNTQPEIVIQPDNNNLLLNS